jgi:PAS domain S-box-containing protein
MAAPLDVHDPSLNFASGGGALGALVRTHGWCATPLGPVTAWPQSLKAAAGLVLGSPIAMSVLWGPDLVQIYNDTYAPIAGAKHPQALGQAARDCWPEAWDVKAPIYAAVLRGEVPSFQGQKLTIERLGRAEEAWFDLAHSPLRDDTGAIAGVLVTMIETTEHVAHESLRECNADLERQVVARTRQLTRTWQVSPDLLSILNPDGYFEATNPAWGVALGWSEAEIRQMRFLDLVHPEDADPSAAAFARMKQGEPVLHFENRYACKSDGWRWLSWVIVPEGQNFYCSTRDITDTKLQKEALRGAENRLHQAQKMDAVGQLTGGIAHDFNNMLTGMIGGLDIIRRRLADGRHDDIERFIEIAQQSGERAASLTKRLLAFSRQQSLTLAVLDPNELAAGMEELLQRTLGENFGLALVLQPDIWSVEVDANQLENALLNLALNARDAMPGGGRLTIDTANRRIEKHDRARPSDLPPGDYVAIGVKDTGSGMSPDVIEHAFEPFFTTKQIGEGTGLGLSMVSGFAKQSGGCATIASQIGAGTVVTLLLPRVLAAAQVVESAAPVEPHYATAGETVLVVDDEAMVRLLLTEVLTELGYDFVEAVDGNAALAILQSAQRVDLLMSDIGLTGMSGYQLAEIARALRPGLKILFISGHGPTAIVRGTLIGAGIDMLAKPFSIEALSTKIKSMLSAT